MFFTRASKVIAWLIFVPSLLGYLAITFAALLGSTETLADLLGIKPALIPAQTTEFGRGIAVGIAFGLAAEISDFLAKICETSANPHVSIGQSTDNA